MRGDAASHWRISNVLMPVCAETTRTLGCTSGAPLEPLCDQLPLHILLQGAALTVMASTSNVENLSPQILRGVLKEMTELVKGPPEGIKVHMNDEDITDIQATITGPAGTPYAGGMFRVKLALGKDFPSAPPKGYFLTKIFHPNVASNGEICVNTLKKDWKADLGIRHVLLVIKCLLIVPNAESALNEEAGKLLLEAYDDYAARAKMITEIHAQGPKVAKGETSGEGSNQDGPQAKKHASDKKISADRKKLLKDKKRTLKRL